MFFPFEKLFLNVRLCLQTAFWWRHLWCHLHVTMLPFWAKFSNGLVRWSIGIIQAKNNEAVSKFVKVMPRILVAASFFRTRCRYHINYVYYLAYKSFLPHSRACMSHYVVRPSARPSLTLGMFSHRLEYFENNSTDDYLKVYTRVDPNMDDLV